MLSIILNLEIIVAYLMKTIFGLNGLDTLSNTDYHVCLGIYMGNVHWQNNISYDMTHACKYCRRLQMDCSHSHVGNIIHIHI